MAAAALIFDLDGTIWDSARWFAQGLEAAGAAAYQDAHNRLIGTGNIVSEIERSGMSRKKILKLTLSSAGPPPLFNGAIDSIEELRQRKIPLAIATNLPGSIALPMLDMVDLAKHFSCVIHAGVCRTPKPHPRSIIMALETLGVLANPSVYYVGDRHSDAEAAGRAGISMTWVEHGYERPAAGLGIRLVSLPEILDL